MQTVMKSARLPKPVVDQVKKAADEDGRSFNNMLVRILEEWAKKQA